MIGSPLTGSLLIGADAVHGKHGEFTGVDPATGAPLEPNYGLGGVEDVQRACELAEAAFDTYRETSPETRAGFLSAIADGVDALGDDLVARVTAETGIPAARATGELARTTGQLRLFATVLRDGDWQGQRIDIALPERKPLPRPDLRRRLIPVGPVVVFSAGNFPLAFSVAGGDTASALAAGAPVIVKAHSAHPGVSEMVGRVIQRAVADAGLPEGVFSLIFGSGREAGIALVTDPRVKAVGFTGSRSGGLALVAAAQARPEPIPVYAEMSSINPVIVLPHALAARGAEIGAGLLGSMSIGQGQLCTSPGLVFALNGPGVEDFVAAAAAALRDVPAAPMLSATIQRAFSEGVEKLRKSDGVEEVSSGHAHVFRTTNAEFAENPALQKEVFGASSLIVTVDTLDDLRDTLATLEGQLTMTLHLDDADHAAARDLLPLLERKAGRIIVNGWPTGVEVCAAMVHGGPFPATSDSRTTSVGTAAIERFLRPVAYQNMPFDLLPVGLADA